jgi:hypothetical protein
MQSNPLAPAESFARYAEAYCSGVVLFVVRLDLFQAHAAVQLRKAKVDAFQVRLAINVDGQGDDGNAQLAGDFWWNLGDAIRDNGDVGVEIFHGHHSLAKKRRFLKKQKPWMRLLSSIAIRNETYLPIRTPFF